MIRAAARDFDFPEPPTTVHDLTQAEAYLRRLIAHVDDRDWARGFELRVGAKQADWTPDQVKAFADHNMARPMRDTDKHLKPLSAFRVERLRLEPPIDDACVRTFADATLAMMVSTIVNRRRPAGGDAAVPITVCGILATGWLLCAPDVSREDRIVLVTAMARAEPLYGWIVGADMFVHSIDGTTSVSTTRDAVGVHFGTRTTRGFLRRMYTFVEGRAVFAEPASDLFNEITQVTDPYAFVFAPPTKGPPS